MPSPSTFEDACMRAVTPGTERLLAGVALCAAGRRKKDAASDPEDYRAAYGTEQLDPVSLPMSTDSVLWLASCAKLVTIIAVLQCVERGLFSLDDPADVDRLLPEWVNPEILTGWVDDETPILQPAKEKITLRMLLMHTSGFAYDFMQPDLLRWRKSRDEGPLAMQVPITVGFQIPLIFEPGTSWSYGPGVDLAGLMVARANDETLEAYMRRNIFDVLGMNDTSFHIKEHNELFKRLVPMTTRLASGELIDGDAPDAVFTQPLAPTDDFGGAGLFGTAEDFLKTLKAILHDDGRLLKTESIDLMFQPHMSPAQQKGLDAMLSVPALAGGERSPGTPGSGSWSHTISGIIALHESDVGLQSGWIRWGGAPNLKWWIDRKGGTCGIFATQLYPPGETEHAFLWKLFQEDVVKHFE